MNLLSTFSAMVFSLDDVEFTDTYLARLAHLIRFPCTLRLYFMISRTRPSSSRKSLNTRNPAATARAFTARPQAHWRSQIVSCAGKVSVEVVPCYWLVLGIDVFVARHSWARAAVWSGISNFTVSFEGSVLMDSLFELESTPLSHMKARSAHILGVCSGILTQCF